MHDNGLLERVEDAATGKIDYIRTEKAAELDPILQGLAKWAQRHIKAEIALEDRDADVLMWTLQRRIIVEELPSRRSVVRFNFSDATSPASTYWLISKPGETIELCASDPKFDVDLYIETEVTVMTGIYLGRRTLSREIEEGRFFMSGDQRLARTIQRWLKISIYADVESIARVEYGAHSA